jgi:hypothetical protein
MSEIFNLKQYCYTIYLTLLKKHIKSKNLKPSDDEQICVKAFCVLAHAALEEYFENLTKSTLLGAYKKYKTGKIIESMPKDQAEIDSINIIINQIIKTLVLSSSYAVYTKNGSETLKGHKAKLESVSMSVSAHDIVNFTKKTQSYTKELLVETNKYFESSLVENHGTSLKYLLKLLIPVGIDVPENNTFINSLQNLAKYRGSYAHSKGDIIELVSPPDVARYLIDTLKMCSQINENMKEFNLFLSK